MNSFIYNINITFEYDMAKIDIVTFFEVIKYDTVQSQFYYVAQKIVNSLFLTQGVKKGLAIVFNR